MKNNDNNIFWYGKVIDKKNDETKSGQLKVHIYNDTDDLSDDEQIWCMTVTPLTSFGSEMVSVPIDALVFGVYADNIHKRNPIVIGQLNVNGDSETVDYKTVNTSRNSINNDKHGDTVSQKRNEMTWNISNSLFSCADKNEIEKSKANNTYTELHSIQTETNHLIEINDNKDNGYIAIRCNNGDLLEIDKNGISIVSDKEINIINKNGNGNICMVKDNNIHAGNNVNIFAGSNVNVTANGNVNVKSQKLDVNCSGDMNFNAGGAFKVNASIIKLN